jgi:hypothetical protein
MKLTPYQRAERAMKTPRHYYVGRRKQSVRKAVKLHTVNVIEMTDGNFQGIRSFTDDVEGNRRAEKLFKRCMRENVGSLPQQDYQDASEEGYWESSTGYQIFLTHSI